MRNDNISTLCRSLPCQIITADCETNCFDKLFHYERVNKGETTLFHDTFKETPQSSPDKSMKRTIIVLNFANKLTT